MNKEELIERTKEFAHRCVKLGLSLPTNTLGKHISGQIIRCSTSVADIYSVACVAQSGKSFISKLNIVKEADESIFWLEFIKDEALVKPELLKELITEAKALTSIFIASRKTMVLNNNK
ncbi:MAG: four helix bundle protein [Bacteroidales bacterium]|nr:four helix bundle protein [Bacteroidales bacterium]